MSDSVLHTGQSMVPAFEEVRLGGWQCTVVHIVKGEGSMGGGLEVRVRQLNRPGVREGFPEEATVNPNIER